MNRFLCPIKCAVQIYRENVNTFGTYVHTYIYIFKHMHAYIHIFKHMHAYITASVATSLDDSIHTDSCSMCIHRVIGIVSTFLLANYIASHARSYV